jgi:hypothetical protein
MAKSSRKSGRGSETMNIIIIILLVILIGMQIYQMQGVKQWIDSELYKSGK